MADGSCKRLCLHCQSLERQRTVARGSLEDNTGPTRHTKNTKQLAFSERISYSSSAALLAVTPPLVSSVRMPLFMGVTNIRCTGVLGAKSLACPFLPLPAIRWRHDRLAQQQCETWCKHHYKDFCGARDVLSQGGDHNEQ